MPGSCSYVSTDATVDECFRIYRVFQREKHLANIGAPRKFKVQIWEPDILVQRILCRHSREERQSNCQIHQESIIRRSIGRLDDA